MQTLNDNPITVSGLILTLALAVLSVAAYYLRLTPEEFGLWAAVLTALSALMHWWLANRTQPDSKPVDSADGVPLVRADNQQPSARAAAAGRMVVKKPGALPRGAIAGSPPDVPVWSK